MKATETSLNTFLSQSKTQFVIPVYQRNYDWMEVQCAQLLDDILQVGSKPDESHFLGSIVYIHDGVYTSSSVKQLVIIDGQQRLTTFSILYLALYKFAVSHSRDEKADEIRELFIVNKYVKEDASKLKLKQSDVNARAFNFLLTENDTSNYQEYSRVVENYNFFSQRINAENFETILNGINSLLFVEISLERGKDDPQRIFESLNSTGLELSQADLIRNYILMGLAPDEQIKMFTNYWEIIEANARDMEREESKVSDFIRDYLTYRTKKIPNKGKVYDEFKSRYPVRDIKFYGETLAELKEFSYYYSKIINPSKEQDSQVRRELELIQRLEINISYPFLLPVLNDYKKGLVTKEELTAILQLVQTYVWRRFIVNLPTNALNKVFMTLYNEVDKENYLESLEKALIRKKGSSRLPNNEEISGALIEKDFYNIQAKNRTYLLELLENHNNREFVSVSNPDLTVEHIFPQTPDEKWYNELNAEELRDFSDRYLNTLANLTLSGNNGSLSNKSFLEKKTMNKDGKQQGYAFSRLWLNQYLREIDEWNVTRLKERYEILLDRFLDIWQYPEVEIDEELETDEDYTIYDAPDPKNRKLDYFVFRDEKIETDEVAKMYYHVIQKLFNENSSAFFHPDLKDLIGLTNNPNDLRAPFAISPTYFIESNIDNGGKFKRLKVILPRFNAEDDLLINYSNVTTKSRNELIDREYWLKKVSADVMSIVDECFGLFSQEDTSLSLLYKIGYIGLQRNGSVDNFILFVPKRSFVRIIIRVSDPGKYVAELKERSLEFLSIGRKGRLKFRITKQGVINNRDFLRNMFLNSLHQVV